MRNFGACPSCREFIENYHKPVLVQMIPMSIESFNCLQQPSIRDILIGNNRCGISYQFRDTYPLCSATGMLSGKLTM